MQNSLLFISSIITFLIFGNIMLNNKEKLLYSADCIEKCSTIPVPRCPYEACNANCKRTNCVSRCSNQEEKPIINCNNYCQDLTQFKTNQCGV